VLLFSPDVSLLEAHSSIHGGKLRYIQPGDVMIVIAHEPYSQTTLDMVEYATAKRADIIAITDSVVSPLTIAARHAFVLPGVQESGYDYLLPVIALSNLIMTFVIREGGDESVRRLEYSDRDMEEFLSYSALGYQVAP
jgi:DNA-binding MurR/RpiR family transcriptional regulator